MTILGLSLFTWFHTLLSLVMLVAGFVVVKDLFHSHIDAGWMAVFLITGVLTSATGFGFPFSRFIESHFVGNRLAGVLAAAILGLYVFKLAGPVALDLRAQRRAGVLLRRLGRDRAAVQEGAGARRADREQRAAVRRSRSRPAGDHHLAVREGRPANFGRR